ncbi:MAG TPA: M48 family metallopeptidase [Solirubrobacteraceae bacterium]|nr:M48 family metallopeptidase [Solirubrobacteraceae bacterium]
MDRGHRRLSLSLVAAVGAAEAAVALLRPRSGVIEPDEVSTTSYFSDGQIERARRFRRPNLALFGLSLAIEGAVLGLLVRRPPAFLRGRDRPLARAAAAGAGVTAGLTVAGLPVAALLRRRSLQAGLTTQSWGGWAVDQAKALGIGVPLSAAGGALFLGLVRRKPQTWWLPAAGATVGLSVVFLFVGPVLLDPIFNRFDPLPEGPLRDTVLRLAQAAGVDVGEVFSVDASRRTTAANAYVNGLGATKRVVLYDTLLRDFTPAEVDLVVAHELAHVRHRDLPRGLRFMAAVAPVAVHAAQRVVEALVPDPEQRRTATVVPAGALALGLVSFALTAASNQLSRRIERRADTYALQLTDAPEPFIAFEQRIAVKNLADPDPPRWLTVLLGTHPPTVERIGTGVAYERTTRSPSTSSAPDPDPEAPGPRTPAGS